MPYAETTAATSWAVNTGNKTDSEIKTRWSEFDALLAGAGLSEVSGETGRLASFASPTLNVSGTSYYGFRIYEFTDTLQSSRPIYIRVDFGAHRNGTGADVNYSPAFRLNVYSGTDGSGNLESGGSSSGPYYFVTTQAGGFTSAQFRAVYSEDYGALAIILHMSSSTMQGFVLERLRDYTGAPTDEGMHIGSFTSSVFSGDVCSNRFIEFNSGSSWTLVRSDYGATATLGYPTILVPQSGLASTLSFDSNTGMALHYPYSYKPYPPLVSVMGVGSTDFGVDAAIVTTRYGVSMTYKGCGTGNFAGNVPNAAANLRLAICTSI